MPGHLPFPRSMHTGYDNIHRILRCMSETKFLRSNLYTALFAFILQPVYTNFNRTIHRWYEAKEFFSPSTTVLPIVIYASSRNWQNIIAKHLVLNDVEPRSAGVVLCQNDTFIRCSISKKLRYLRDDTIRCSIDPGNVIVNWWACLMTSWHMGNLQARLHLVADIWNFLWENGILILWNLIVNEGGPVLIIVSSFDKSNNLNYCLYSNYIYHCLKESSYKYMDKKWSCSMWL